VCTGNISVDGRRTQNWNIRVKTTLRNLARQNYIPEKMEGSGTADHVAIYDIQTADFTRDSFTKTICSSLQQSSDES
jgi:hypothetical protein